MAIDKDEWIEIQHELEGFYGKAVFRYQGQDLQVARRAVAEGKMGLVVYLDGEMSPAWGVPIDRETDEHFKPVTEQVWRKRSKSLYSPKKQKEIVKRFGKRNAESVIPGLYKKYEWYEPMFQTALSLVRQYKRLEGLELVSVGYGAEV